MNRLSRITVKSPDGYKNSDFQDILDKLKSDYTMKVKDGRIEMRLFKKEFEIERFGKKFYVFMWAFGGHVNIEISDNEPSL